MNIASFDPGETTAYVRASVDKTDTGALVIIERMGQWKGMAEMVEVVFDTIDGIDHMVIEDYIVFPSRAKSHAGDKVLTAREIGRLEWLAYYHAGVQDTLQASSMAKQRWPDSRLLQYAPFMRSHTPHERDALRHLLTYVERNLIKPPDERIEVR
jgi:hypothetical protein